MSTLKAIIFDLDGTIADTEKNGHRVAFNMAFLQEGLKTIWDVPAYGEYLKIAGGKERIRKLITSDGFEKQVENIDAYVNKIHKNKKKFFTEIVTSGKLPLRQGIKRIINKAHDEGLKLAVASTANEKSVHTVLEVVLGSEIKSWFDVILAGDIVSRKKPDPEIYNMAVEKLKTNASDCIAVEDSNNGLIAAKASGMKCIITTNVYTENDDFSQADLVVDSLGDPKHKKINICLNPHNLKMDYVTVETLKKFF